MVPLTEIAVYLSKSFAVPFIKISGHVRTALKNNGPVLFYFVCFILLSQKNVPIHPTGTSGGLQMSVLTNEDISSYTNMKQLLLAIRIILHYNSYD